MKVALINPSTPTLRMPAELFDLLRAKAEALLHLYRNVIEDSRKEIKPQPDMYQISEGLLCIASVARHAGHHVEYFQQDFLIDTNQWNNAIKTIASTFDIVGITVLTPTYPSAVRIVENLKSINPHIYVIGGGPHVSVCDVDAVKEGFDAVIRGEGEEIFAEFLEAFENQTSFEHILGLTHKVDGKICRHEDNARCLDGKDFPIPEFELVSSELRRVSTVRISSSRGCGNNCLFCFESRYWKTVRTVPQDRFIECIDKFWRSSEFNLIELSDSSFGAKFEESMDMLKRIASENYDIFFACEMRADKINRQIVDALVKAGFVGVFVGVETGSTELLKKMGKNETPYMMLDALKMLKGKIPIVHTSWMVGFPGENYDTLKDTYTYLEQLYKEELILESRPRVFIPYPGTPIFREPKNFGVTITTRDWEKYTRFSFPPVHRLENLSELEIWSAFIAVFSIGLKYICRRANINPIDYIDTDRLEAFKGHYGQYGKLVTSI
jgi:anaerobic magnesium-protoporphyrin IX monomethyl ester cyclase